MTILAGRIPGRGVSYRPAELSVWVANIVAPGVTENPTWTNKHLVRDYQPEQLKWATNGKLSALTLRRQLGQGPGRPEQEHPNTDEGQWGDMVILRQDADDIEWFRGYLGKSETLIGAEPDVESYTITAFGPEIILAGKVVSGQWHKNRTADNEEIDGSLTDDDRLLSATFRSQLPVIFNEGGRPNASASNWHLAGAPNAGNHCKVFESPGRIVSDVFQAEYWTVQTALRSLVEIVDGYDLISNLTDWQAIDALVGAAPVAEVDVEGMGLLEAIKAVLEPAGFGFAIEPWSVGSRAGHRLLVFSTSNVKTRKRPFLAPGGTAMDSDVGRRAELQRMSFVRDSSEVRNDITVLGDRKRIEVNLALTPDADDRQIHPAWDTYDHDLSVYSDISDKICPLNWSAYQIETFTSRYHKSGDEFWKYKDAFRSFTWNEDGAFSSMLGLSPPNLGDICDDLTDADGNFLARRRRITSSLQYGSSGVELLTEPAWVEMWILGCEAAKIKLPVQFWPDRCGFTLKIDEFFNFSTAGVGNIYRPFEQLPYNSYYVDGVNKTAEIKNISYLNLLYNTIGDLENDDVLQMQIELTCTIDADSCLAAVAERRPNSSWPFRSSKVVSLPHRYKFQQSLNGVEIDDSAQAVALAESIRAETEQPKVAGVLSLRYLTRAYSPGDGIDFTSGRIVDLTSGKPSMITSVVWSFGHGENKTKLHIQNSKGG